MSSFLVCRLAAADTLHDRYHSEPSACPERGDQRMVIVVIISCRRKDCMKKNRTSRMPRSTMENRCRMKCAYRRHDRRRRQLLACNACGANAVASTVPGQEPAPVSWRGIVPYEYDRATRSGSPRRETFGLPYDVPFLTAWYPPLDFACIVRIAETGYSSHKWRRCRNDGRSTGGLG